MPNHVVIRNGYLVEPRPHFAGAVCVEAWCDYFDERRHTEQLALADIELRRARPASREEWARFFDSEFPREPRP